MIVFGAFDHADVLADHIHRGRPVPVPFATETRSGRRRWIAAQRLLNPEELIELRRAIQVARGAGSYVPRYRRHGLA
jgi:hypothetical protein